MELHRQPSLIFGVNNKEANTAVKQKVEILTDTSIGWYLQFPETLQPQQLEQIKIKCTDKCIFVLL